MAKRNTYTLVLALFSGFWSTGVLAEDELEVIYGDDDRRDLYDSDVSSLMFQVARSTAALVRREQIETESSNCRLPATTFGDSMNMCENEPFRDQPNPAFCSGFLVGEDVFVTAGHCITSETDCTGTALVFGFGFDSRNKDVTNIPSDDVYFCKSIIARELNSDTKNDFAVIRLDRKVTGRDALSFRRNGQVAVGQGVTVIGHPSGLPTKVSGGAKVRANDQGTFFVANLDTYGGNSGSAVVDSQTGMVEGILVRGETDYVTSGDCRISNRCLNEACRGEDVTRATMFASYVP